MRQVSYPTLFKHHPRGSLEGFQWGARASVHGKKIRSSPILSLYAGYGTEQAPRQIARGVHISDIENWRCLYGTCLGVIRTEK